MDVRLIQLVIQSQAINDSATVADMIEEEGKRDRVDGDRISILSYRLDELRRAAGNA